ncbi:MULTISPECIES: L-threonylcarbamoyladenylate synthase [Okeania]|uniref:L-threonylcarbamoyladenylate synthase n=1 Tax=Okeania hirsuta TaxID=1458930 RepID=A0A3N6P1N2_9CYAN|nr:MULTISPECIES: L-threonylcarbamoyladenylate synthase [Okeania]NES78551.1 L-threonylcarbamoyladenylate synthase [Okeania sp. SIO1H4]NES91478.1 L-threonylcarbamoyladenylate synthase [Okeania sp. SIO2B9]NET21922.1 L-threonylcarbamoyladenylate synthase [Okeania sp. SIO1H5]NET78721.1 L-threonylcarbamoyladenylate synthase [Okeania sp. SIO1F9]NET95127.1 L-threonylcarbamoyladenylate synthase [Okeania sp. SIO1H2]
MSLVSIETLIKGAISGNLVSFPTDTVPALAALPQKADLIFQAKRRSPDKPLILMGATPASLWPYVRGSDEELQLWQEVAQKYWPGPLTLVLPASEMVPREMNPFDPTTIGIRIPNCDIAREIMTQTGPLATTSANFSGQPPLGRMAEINAQFPDVLVLSHEQEIILASGVPSTVAKWNEISCWEILRQGAVKLKF